VRRPTAASPYARAFFALIEELGLLAGGPQTQRRTTGHPHVRLA
jgi:hypothetical protein